MESRKGSKLSRRKFVQRSMMAGAASTLLPTVSLAAERDVTVPTGPNLYEKIGVRPLINAKGTYTIISGSLSLPEVKQAMEEAGKHYVNMDELMAAVGARLAAITGAEWGVVTTGCGGAQ
jgi:D-glucosaminate-6-phosphate ammonia-lyase